MPIGARGKLLLHRYGLALGVVCLLIALGGGFLAFQAYTADVPTDTVTEEVDVEEFEFTSHTEATVDGPNITLYEPGERLVDLPVYFHSESPTMDLVLELTGPEDAQFDIRVTAEIEATRDDRTFYSNEYLQYSGQHRTDNGSETVEAEINIPTIRAEFSRISERISGVGSLTRTVEVTMEYESSRYDGTLSDSVSLSIVQRGYWLGDDPADDARHSGTVTDEIELERDLTPVALYGVLALVFLLVGGVSIGYSLRDIDVSALETEIARSEFEEWISTGEIPTRAGKQYVKVDSLEDVVDIAIDSNKRVIHDPDLGAYGVIDSDLVYYYSPGADEIEEWLDL